MDRTSALNALINFESPVPTVLEQLGRYPFDSEVGLVELRSTHIAATLERFIIGELGASEIESWANAIECRDDIELAQNSQAREAIHELANPLLTQPLTKLRAQWWVSRLHRSAT